jgi:citronellol/citronellal dehydrogenase
MANVNPDGVLAGRVAVVTGASRGIGDAIARRFAMEGARVVVSARTLDEGGHALPGSIRSVVRFIEDAGGEALAVQCDLSDADERARLVDAARAAYGTVDILVNNAAVTWFMPVTEFTERRFAKMMEVQVRAPFHLAQLVLPDMQARGSGWILNISSHAALHPDVRAGRPGGVVYGMCKAALERFTTGLASEVYAAGIGVNVISPGLVATPGVVHHRLINDSNRDRVTPVEHMAEACLHLCHGDPSVLTGRIDYADAVMAAFDLQAAELIGPPFPSAAG